MVSKGFSCESLTSLNEKFENVAFQTQNPTYDAQLINVAKSWLTASNRWDISIKSYLRPKLDWLHQIWNSYWKVLMFIDITLKSLCFNVNMWINFHMYMKAWMESNWKLFLFVTYVPKHFHWFFSLVPLIEQRFNILLKSAINKQCTHTHKKPLQLSLTIYWDSFLTLSCPKIVMRWNFCGVLRSFDWKNLGNQEKENQTCFYIY